MNIRTLIAAFFVLMMAGAAAHAEGVSNEDIKCRNNAQCAHSIDAPNLRPS